MKISKKDSTNVPFRANADYLPFEISYCVKIGGFLLPEKLFPEKL